MSVETDTHYYRERHHVARPQNMACRTVFVSMEYDAAHPPRVIEIEDVRWVRERKERRSKRDG